MYTAYIEQYLQSTAQRPLYTVHTMHTLFKEGGQWTASGFQDTLQKLCVTRVSNQPWPATLPIIMINHNLLRSKSLFHCSASSHHCCIVATFPIYKGTARSCGDKYYHFQVIILLIFLIVLQGFSVEVFYWDKVTTCCELDFRFKMLAVKY